VIEEFWRVAQRMKATVAIVTTAAVGVTLTCDLFGQSCCRDDDHRDDSGAFRPLADLLYTFFYSFFLKAGIYLYSRALSRGTEFL